MKHPQGTRVRANCWKADSNIATRETEGWVIGVIVRYVTDEVVRMKTDEGVTTDRWAETIQLIPPPLVSGALVRQRCGLPARITRHDAEGERPIEALLLFKDGAVRTLSFSPYGYFYKSYELPVDLVPM